MFKPPYIYLSWASYRFSLRCLVASGIQFRTHFLSVSQTLQVPLETVFAVESRGSKMFSRVLGMVSNPLAIASNLIAVASNLLAMASNLVAMASGLQCLIRDSVRVKRRFASVFPLRSPVMNFWAIIFRKTDGPIKALATSSSMSEWILAPSGAVDVMFWETTWKQQQWFPNKRITASWYVCNLLAQTL